VNNTYLCGAGTQIPSRHTKFLIPTPDSTSKRFRLRLRNDLSHGKLKIIVLFVRLALFHKLGLWNRKLIFWLRHDFGSTI